MTISLEHIVVFHFHSLRYSCVFNSDASDVTKALCVWPTIGRSCVPETLESINGTVSSQTRGARRGSSTPVPSVFIVITDADSHFNDSSWTDTGVPARRAGLDVYTSMASVMRPFTMSWRRLPETELVMCFVQMNTIPLRPQLTNS